MDLKGQNEEERVVFNSEKVIYHSPIASLANATREEILAEPSFKEASVEFAMEHGGPLTREIIQNFKNILTEEEFSRLRIDTKIQEIGQDSYSNNPGWHCDYFGGIDEQSKHLIRYNPGLEPDCKIFLILSGEPTTEFISTRNIEVDFHQSSWKDVSDYIESIKNSKDLFQIPIATPVELKGNELHRVTLYEGKDPTARYLMRATVFPKNHSEEGKYSNEQFNWEPFKASPITTILGNYQDFLGRAFAHLKESGIDVNEYEMTHLCYRVATQEEYENKKKELAEVGYLVSEIFADGRPYSVFKLNTPVTYLGRELSLIALPAPKADNSYESGLQHVAFLTEKPLQSMIDQYPSLKFDTQEQKRDVLPELKLRYDDLVVKFQHDSFEDLAQRD
jgi:predicted metalloenzyme YecM